MGWTLNKSEHDRRRAICETCSIWRIQVSGYCESCKRPFSKALTDGPDLEASVVCKCGGKINVKSVVERCGTGEKLPNGEKLGCGCPLATRVYSYCPKGKW